MRTAAIMQPYFFPYIGYFHLIAAADVFVHFDDVQYIEHGWSNRNRILIQGKAHTVTLPVRGAPKEATYSQREYCIDQIERSILRPIRMNYARAPQFASVMPLIEDILSYRASNVARFNSNLVEKISRFLRLTTDFRFSSEIEIGADLRAQDRVIAKLSAIGATQYINAAGGQSLYSKEAFDAAGIDLKFIQSELVPYTQFSNDPVVGLSIIDVLMFNSVDAILEKLWVWNLALPVTP
ncbi:MAG: WbqC family protein [Pseudomonadota bacterium]